MSVKESYWYQNNGNKVFFKIMYIKFTKGASSYKNKFKTSWFFNK